MSFDYAKFNLPANARWEMAAETCHEWLTKNMGQQFGPERIDSFMQKQPVTAAKSILQHCPDFSEESVTLVLLGPVKVALLENEAMSRKLYGDRAVELMQALATGKMKSAEQERDAIRVYLVEGISSMGDQLIGRAKIDKHHQVRWDMLESFEANFAEVKGRNPGLDKMFEACLTKSRAALEALDKAPKTPKPPQP